ncbi:MULTISPECIES: Ig-like domain-containing protein [Enterobacter cloacae complex]|uniref:Ig-like domain-containing protein n=1 Tax=Enterobacter cloacae complex TaxID=354276 RepID=UPI00044E4CE7|nr:MULTISPECIES: Ig-like domain-containing protein [Enterobacter cloacae complex]AWR70016.1 DNA breaking-rejoining protein [Enterobacter hormaechei subsp. xiangfangensis]AXM00809.1 DNA breaking-rejoining protein [Enterobacter hormaechei subsp. xiangfangensis]EHK3212578.1 Ig domain-containing protein [Enterobacter hormaechei]EHK3217557.1 Ig domain-containing protein [Enterobacter hormaechei]EHK3223253.1 Ig domain-containing protein [Enterobacter hormaechei]
MAANCPTDNTKLFGRAIVLEVADGCADTLPLESEWMALAAGTSKGFDFSPNSVTSDADDTKGYVENIVTNADFTISFEGEVRRNDKLDQYGVGRLIKYFNAEIQAARQPTLWVRMEFGPITFIGYMLINALSSDGGSNDIVTFSTEFKVAAADTIQIVDTDEEVPTTGVTVTPTSASVAAGASTTFAVNVAPADATDKTFTVTSSVPARAIATISGNTVTVNAPSGATAGTANITVTTTDGSFTAVFAVTVTV